MYIAYHAVQKFIMSIMSKSFDKFDKLSLSCQNFPLQNFTKPPS